MQEIEKRGHIASWMLDPKLLGHSADELMAALHSLQKRGLIDGTGTVGMAYYNKA